MNTKRPIDRYYAKTLNDINENFAATAKEDKVHFPGIGHFLRAKRCDCLMQQKYVEEITGINRSGISKYENAQQIPPLDKLKTLLKLYKATKNEKEEAIRLWYYDSQTTRQNKQKNWKSQNQFSKKCNTM